MKTIYILTWCHIIFGMDQITIDRDIHVEHLTRHNDTLCDGIATIFTDTLSLNKFIKKEKNIYNLHIDTLTYYKKP